MQRRRLATLVGALALSGAVALPVAATTQVRSTVSEDATVAHDCGIVEHLHVEGTATAYFDADGGWIRDLVHLRYSSRFESTITDASITSSSHQTVIFTPEGITASGQGFFVQAGGALIVLDAGHIRGDWEGTTLFRSARIIPFGDSPEAALAEAALCEALG